MKQQDKAPEELIDMEKWNLLKKEFRVMIVNMTFKASQQCTPSHHSRAQDELACTCRLNLQAAGL